MRRTFIFGYFVRSFCTDAMKKRRLAALWAQTIQAEIIHIHKQKQRNLFQQKLRKLRKLQIPDKSQSPVDIKNGQDTQTKDNIYQSQSLADINRKQNISAKDNQDTQAKDVAHLPQAPNEIKQEKEIPLIDHLRELKLPDNFNNYLQKQYSQTQLNEGKNEFMKIFNPLQGVKLPNELSAVQQRFLQAKNKKGNIAFYPTSLITTKIFVETQKQMRNYSRESKTIFVGKPGISKSMSLLFYWYLSYVNAAFRYQFPTYAKELIKQNMLRPVGYKILYFNYNAEKFKQKNYIELILSQCPQIQKQFSQKNKQKVNSFQQTLEIMSQLYQQKQIKCFVIADQLNAAARIFKQYNQRSKTIKSKITRNFDKIRNKNIQSLQQTALLLSLVHFAIRNTIPRIYNSSSNIQPELLGKEDQVKLQYLALGMRHHTKQTIIPIEYDESTSTLSQLKEIYRFIWYGIINYLNLEINNEYQSKIKVIQQIWIKKCNELAEEKGFCSFVTPLSIQDGIKNTFKQLSLSYIHQMDENTVKVKIAEIYQTIFKNGMDKLIEKSLGFLNDSNIKNKQLKYKIILGYLKYLSQKPTDITALKFLLNQNINQHQLEQFYDKDIFVLQTGQLKLVISLKQLQILSYRWLFELASNPNLTQLFEMFLEIVPGQYLEFAVTQLLKQNSNAFLQLGKNTYRYQKIQYFKHFHGNNVYVLPNIFHIYKQVYDKNDLNVYIFGCPLTSNKFQLLAYKIFKLHTLRSPNNPRVDLLAIRKNSSNNCQIVSFDFCITQQAREIKLKLDKADQYLKKQLDQKFYFLQSNDKITKFAAQVFQKIKQYKDKDNFIINFKSSIQKIKISSNKNQSLRIEALKEEILKYIETQTNAEEKIINLFVKNQIIKLFSGCEYYKHLKQWRHVIVTHITDQNERKKYIQIPQPWVTKSGIKVSFQVNQIQKVNLISNTKGVNNDAIFKTLKVVLNIQTKKK